MTLVVVPDSLLTSSRPSVDLPSFFAAPQVPIEGMNVNRIVYEANVDPGPTLGGNRTTEERAQWRFQFDTNVLHGSVTNIVFSGNTMHANIFASTAALGYVYYHLPSGHFAQRTLNLSQEIAQGPPP